jgi:hypothetical protein
MRCYSAFLRVVFPVSVCVLLLGGCHAVYSTQPLGEAVVPVSPSDWEGTWVHRDSAVTVAVIDEAKGLLEVGWIEEQQGRLAFEHFQVRMTKSGRWMFGSTEGMERPSYLVWGHIEKDDNQLILWTPNLQRMRELVTGGALAGRLLGDDVLLVDPDPEAVETIMAVTEGAMNWEQPMVFRRIGR